MRNIVTERVLLAVQLIVFCAGVSAISCCGYSTRSLLPGYMQNVYIKLFENRTLKPQLDEWATQSVITAFASGSNLRIVDEKNADIVVEGTVTGYAKNPYTYTSNQNILEYKIDVTFSIRCVDVVKNEVFWEGNVSDWATYAPSGNEDEAILEAIKKTAEKLVTTLLTNW
jgi:hypothetical protein